MCYGISRAYKESANCRLEAQYAYQRQKEMVPLMVEEGYRADGWLGMLLGVRLWYAFCGSVLTSESSFEGKMEELCRELGDRGLVTTTQAGHADDNEGSTAKVLPEAHDTCAEHGPMWSGSSVVAPMSPSSMLTGVGGVTAAVAIVATLVSRKPA